LFPREPVAFNLFVFKSSSRVSRRPFHGYDFNIRWQPHATQSRLGDDAGQLLDGYRSAIGVFARAGTKDQ
jgi:hypothetical protein